MRKSGCKVATKCPKNTPEKNPVFIQKIRIFKKRRVFQLLFFSELVMYKTRLFWRVVFRTFRRNFTPRFAHLLRQKGETKKGETTNQKKTETAKTEKPHNGNHPK